MSDSLPEGRYPNEPAIRGFLEVYGATIGTAHVALIEQLLADYAALVETVTARRPSVERPPANGHWPDWPTWDLCEGLLSFLNQKTGKRFDARTYDGKPTRSLQLIHARLHSLGPEKGVDIVEGVILRKWQQWKGTEMEVFLRPSTLFGKEKFEQYRGEVLL